MMVKNESDSYMIAANRFVVVSTEMGVKLYKNEFINNGFKLNFKIYIK